MTTANTATATREAAFVACVDQLIRRGDRARLAALRRLCSPPARWGPDAYAAGLPLLPPGLPSYAERDYLLVAGLHALWHQTRSYPIAGHGSFGSAMRHLARAQSSGGELAQSVERRFSVLLVSEGDRLVYHLRQAVRLLASQDIPLDFTRLLSDLRHWGHPDRFAQIKWARDFWSPPPSIERPEGESQ
jgi:CRISPR system Cascade subunit CasB